MRISTAFIWAVLALTANAFADAPNAQGTAATSSNSDVAANHNGASATNTNAASATAGTHQAQANAAGGSEMSATLSKPVDARKAKPGDPVAATNDRDTKTADGTSINKGSKLLGHVTKSQPLDKAASGRADANAGSMLGIVFDKAVLKDGREVPLNATIQALSAAESDTSVASDMGGVGASTVAPGMGATRAGGGGLVGGVGGSVTGAVNGAGGVAGGVGHGVHGTVGGVTGATAHSAGAVGGLSSSGALTSGSKGVFGTRDLDLVTTSAGSAEGSLITSSTRNVRLDGGTRMLLSDSAGPMAASSASQAAGSVSQSQGAKDPSSRTGPAPRPQEPHERN